MKVSVCVLSYNHGPYLRDCLQSLVAQETDFPFEVIVSDDCSRDDSREIIAEFAARYPHIVRAQYHPTNVGGNNNYWSVHRLARGEYVAHMDGDDSALPDKLQRQADYLDAHPGVSICWHRMLFFNAQGVQREHPGRDFAFLDRPITRADLMLLGPFGPHSATMYRRRNYSERYATLDCLVDWLLSVELMADGVGVMLPDVLARYRVHSAGTSGGATASRRTREYLRGCQLEAVQRFPEYRRLLALRSLMLAGLDFARRQPYYRLSLDVFRACRAFPDVTQLPRLVRFYHQSKLPAEFG